MSLLAHAAFASCVIVTSPAVSNMTMTRDGLAWVGEMMNLLIPRETETARSEVISLLMLATVIRFISLGVALRLSGRFV
jgi:hypothetical protein